MSKLAFMTGQRRAFEIAQRNRDGLNAYHEAGHAVVDRALGMATTEMSIGFGGDGSLTGETVSTPFARSLSNFERLVSLAAGAAAEAKVHSGRPYDAADRDQAYDIALAECRDVRDAAALLDRAQHKADEILMANWTAVRDLAEALIQRRHMTTTEIAPYLSRVALVPAPAREPAEPAPRSRSAHASSPPLAVSDGTLFRDSSGGGAVFTVLRDGRAVGGVIEARGKFTAWRGSLKIGVYADLQTAARAV